MTNFDFLNFIGLLFNLVGTIILAISLSKYLYALHGSIAIHDMTLRGLVKQENWVLSSENIGGVLKDGIKNAVYKTKFGLILIIIGFILQLIPYLSKIANIFL